ncbi:L-lactate dehydrogenase [Velocimicrobium porci]|uniref:L-lactate dehydrogenase n=1 Tax=Velocimicrobium porci TaxID=2606634 RepID=A0A6L5XV58_9FIRM|nr:L-lactate dehydrogenase [Velocimicrobium porci]MSS62387.1 L-lactate dehydrogenase [Velocimicrobium porci]
MQPKIGKLVLIGAGNVGSAVLNSLMQLNVVNEIVVIDYNKDKALGEVLDASHTTAFVYSSNVVVRVGDYSDCADAQIIIMTAGPSIKPGDKRDRMVLLDKNVTVMCETMEKITSYTREAIIINVSNPLDILTYVAQTKFDYPKEKLFGTGTLLDTARFNRMIADICHVDAKNVTGFVLGEHGTTSFVPWNTVNIVGVPFEEFKTQFSLTENINKEKILNDIKEAGMDILQLKGYTSSGIALSVCRLVDAIIHNEHCVLPVSILLNGQYGIHDVSLSLPCVITSGGIERVLELPLDENGKKDLQICVDKLKNIIKDLNL